MSGVAENVVYEIENPPDRRLATGGPLLSEYFGPTWSIGEVGGSAAVVIIPDPGDGSALPLVKRIVAFLNSENREG